MKRSLIINLILFLLVIIFAVQNSEIISLQLYFWPISISKALLIIIVLLIGVVLGIFASSFAGKNSKNKKEVKSIIAEKPEKD